MGLCDSWGDLSTLWIVWCGTNSHSLLHSAYAVSPILHCMVQIHSSLRGARIHSALRGADTLSSLHCTVMINSALHSVDKPTLDRWWYTLHCTAQINLRWAGDDTLNLHCTVMIHSALHCGDTLCIARWCYTLHRTVMIHCTPRWWYTLHCTVMIHPALYCSNTFCTSHFTCTRHCSCTAVKLLSRNNDTHTLHCKNCTHPHSALGRYRFDGDA